MITVRPSAQRGVARLDWLHSRHSFSFGHYHDPAHTGFGVLRVINEDEVAPGAGFGTHGHRDMEIVSYVLDGALEHRDSIGSGSVMRPGDVQRMTAGSGIRHSEFNASASAPVRFLQIWLLPEQTGLAPGYEQRHFAAPEREGRLRLVGSRDGREGSVTIHQDVDLHAALLAPGTRAVHPLRDGRKAWLQLARGAVEVDGVALAAGDGAAITGTQAVTIEASAGAELLLFDLAA